MYVNRHGESGIPDYGEELDLSKDMKEESCKEEFAPDSYVDGPEAQTKLESCTRICGENDECEMVVMGN